MVHVIEARELKPADRNGMSDPVCFVDALGTSQHTDVKKKTLSALWDQIFFFNAKLTDDGFYNSEVVFVANVALLLKSLTPLSSRFPPLLSPLCLLA